MSSNTLANTLPADPEKAGNVWCDACQQSISESRAAAHLVSKKHLTAGTKSSKKDKTAGSAEEAEDDSIAQPATPAAATSATKAPKKAAKAGGLTPDPDKPGHYWCGLCQVSLTAAKAEGHTETSRHKDNATKAVSGAMKAGKNAK
jgi:hypothetical protein